MKIRAGFGKSQWSWQCKQILIIPNIAIQIKTHYYGYFYLNFVFTWLAWGAWISISFPPKIYADDFLTNDIGENDEAD